MAINWQQGLSPAVVDYLKSFREVTDEGQEPSGPPPADFKDVSSEQIRQAGEVLGFDEVVVDALLRQTAERIEEAEKGTRGDRDTYAAARPDANPDRRTANTMPHHLSSLGAQLDGIDGVPVGGPAKLDRKAIEEATGTCRDLLLGALGDDKRLSDIDFKSLLRTLEGPEGELAFIYQRFLRFRELPGGTITEKNIIDGHRTVTDWLVNNSNGYLNCELNQEDLEHMPRALRLVYEMKLPTNRPV